jgi:hypothetical protein
VASLLRFIEQADVIVAARNGVQFPAGTAIDGITEQPTRSAFADLHRGQACCGFVREHYELAIAHERFGTLCFKHKVAIGIGLGFKQARLSRRE